MEPKAKPPPAADPLPPPPILVVENDPSIRQALKWALEDDGFVVMVAADGREALERASGQRPALVVLDMMLPVLDGAAVADGLRAAGQAPPILLITADGRATEKARRVGAFAHLAKPFELDELVATVRRGLGMG